MAVSKPKRTAGIFGSIFTQANASLGAGILGFPYAFASAGLTSGVISTMVLVTLAMYTLYALAVYAHRVNASSYQECVHIYLGKFASSAVQFILMVYLVGACIVYLAVMYDVVEPFMGFIFGENSITSQRVFLVPVLCALCVFPICLLKDISYLAPSSILAVIGVVYLTIFVAVQFVVDTASGVKLPEADYLINSNTFAHVLPEYFLALPIIAFAFQCHVLLIPVYASLKNPKMWKMLLVIVGSLLLCFILYVVTGVFGYLSFGVETQGDILLNYGPTNIYALIARLLVGCTSMFSYPISSFTSRLVIESFFLKNRSFMEWEFYAVTILFTVICTVGAIVLEEISDIFGVIGSFGAVSLMFVFPGAIIVVTSFKFLTKREVPRLPDVLIGVGSYPLNSNRADRHASFLDQISEIEEMEDEKESVTIQKDEGASLIHDGVNKLLDPLLHIPELSTMDKIKHGLHLIWGATLIVLGVFMGVAGITTTIVKYLSKIGLID